MNKNKKTIRKSINFDGQTLLYRDVEKVAKKREWSFHKTMIKAMSIGIKKLLGK